MCNIMMRWYLYDETNFLMIFIHILLWTGVILQYVTWTTDVIVNSIKWYGMN